METAETRKLGMSLAPLATLITLFLICPHYAWAQEQSERLSRATNQSSQRYEINQTFGGQAYRKDNNIWVYNKVFAELFGMPQQYIEDVQGVAAAAFRIEDASYQECGFGGQAEACRKVEQCILDLYFDEAKNPLPWATDIKMQWKPSYSSMIWLRPLDVRAEKPYGTLAVEPPPGIIRNKGGNSTFIPFADPVSKVEASFTTNAKIDRGRSDDVSGGMHLLGYVRDFYQNLSVISLQFGCTSAPRKVIEIWLNSRREGFYEPPVAKFNKVSLPAGFVQRINERIKVQSDRNAVFYRSLFASPVGSKSSQANNSVDQ